MYIIGAGISGLTIADFFRDVKNILVIEKNDYPGGRIKTLNSDSSYFEIGSQFFCKSDSHFRKLIDEKNLNEDIIPLDFSDISFYHENNLFKNIDDIIYVIQKSLEQSNTIKENEYFDEWFLKNFDENKLFIPKGIIRAITFSDSSNVLAYYGIYILETFFEECYTFKNGLEEIINSLSQNITIEQKIIKKFIIQDHKIAGMKIDNEYIDTRDDIVVSTAAPGEIEIDNHSKLNSVLNNIKFNGCIVIFFKIQSTFSDWPSYIFFPENKYNISVIEQFKIGKDSFIGCLLPYQNVSYEKEVVVSESVDFIEKLFRKNIGDDILDTFYYDWKKGMPIVNAKYVSAVKNLKKINIKNLYFAGDYTTLYPSMDSAVKSGFEIIEKV
jgi:protoporphyrinogen oxidase